MRFLWILGALAVTLMAAPPVAAERTVPLSGVLRNQKGQVLPGVTIRAYRQVAPGWQIVTATTRPDGTFSLRVPRDRWVVMADADELVARGYFCVPGWFGEDPVFIGGPICEPVELPLGVPSSPLTCGRLGDPIFFEAVPTRPDIAVTKEQGKEPILHLTYPWTTLPMLTVRQYVIEKSVDMVHWEPVSTVALDGFGRVDLPVASSAKEPFCLYRAVESTPVIVISP